MRRWLMVGALSLALAGCDSPFPELTPTPGAPAATVPTTTADYIKSAVMYREGDGVVIYFIVADEHGRMTTASGSAALQLTDDKAGVYAVVKDIEEDDFYETTLGQGAFEREALVYSFGRIPFDKMKWEPEGTLEMQLGFKTATKTMKGKDSIFVP